MPDNVVTSWLEDPEFNALDDDTKRSAMLNYFDTELADDEFRALPEETQKQVKDNYLYQYNLKQDDTPIEDPGETIKSKIGKFAAASTDPSKVIEAGAKGLVEGVVTELPKTVAGAVQGASNALTLPPAPGMIDLDPETIDAFKESNPVAAFPFLVTQKMKELKAGIHNTAADVKDWFTEKGEKWFGGNEYEGLPGIVYEGTKMAGPSIGSAVTLGPAGTAMLFAANQYQQTIDNAYEQAQKLQSQGKMEEAQAVMDKARGYAGIINAGIEGAGEYYGTKGLSNLLGIAEDVLLKKGVKKAVTDFFKNLGVEVGTEAGQAAGQAAVEKYTAIRPDAEPLAEALNVVGPTIVLSGLTAVGGGMKPTAAKDLLLGEDEKDVTAKELLTGEKQPVAEDVPFQIETPSEGLPTIDEARAKEAKGLTEAQLKKRVQNLNKIFSRDGLSQIQKLNLDVYNQELESRGIPSEVQETEDTVEQAPKERPTTQEEYDQLFKAKQEKQASDLKEKPVETLRDIIDNQFQKSEKSAEASAQDIAVEQEVAWNDVLRNLAPEAKKVMTDNPGLMQTLQAAVEGKVSRGQADAAISEFKSRTKQRLLPSAQGFELVEKDKNTIPYHLRSAISIMEGEVNSGEVARGNQGEGTDHILASTYPEWFRMKNKQGEKGWSRDEFNRLLELARQGQKMTDNQELRFRRLLDIAEEYNQTHPDLVDTDESEAAKYEPMPYDDFVLYHSQRKALDDVTPEEADAAEAAYDEYVFELRKKAGIAEKEAPYAQKTGTETETAGEQTGQEGQAKAEVGRDDTGGEGQIRVLDTSENRMATEEGADETGVTIPELKSSVEGAKFGLEATPEQAKELQRIYDENQKEVERLTSEKKLDEAGDLAMKNQFYNDALHVINDTSVGKKLKERLKKTDIDKIAESVQQSKNDNQSPTILKKAEQIEIGFDPVEQPSSKAIPKDRLKVRMETTGKIGFDGNVVRNTDDAAALLSHLKESAQEQAYFVTTDKDGVVLEIHKYGKGAKSSAAIVPSEAIGMVLRNKNADTVYFVHNHPSGFVSSAESLNPSREDKAILSNMKAALDLKNIKTSSLIIAGNNYVPFDIDSTGKPSAIRETIRKTKLPVKERRMKINESEKSEPEQITDSETSKRVIKEKYGNKEGVLFLNTKLSDIGFEPWPKGMKTKDAAARIITRMEELNASGLIINIKSSSKARISFIRNIGRGLSSSGAGLVDVIDQGESWYDKSPSNMGGINTGNPYETADAIKNLNVNEVLFKLDTEEGTDRSKRTLQQDVTTAENLQKASDIVIRAMKASGLPKVAIDRITVELKPIIDLRGKDVERALEDWAKQGKQAGRILGVTTISPMRATVELSLEQNWDKLEKTAFHESFHVAARWILPENQYTALMNHFKGNEEVAADAFADFMTGKQTEASGRVKGIMTTLKNFFRKLRAFINGAGFTTPEQIFGDLASGKFGEGGRGGVGTQVAFSAEEANNIQGTYFKIEDNTYGASPRPNKGESNDPFYQENRRIRDQDKTLWETAKKILKRQLSPGGLLPENVFKQMIERDAQFNAVDQIDVPALVGALNDAIKAEYGKSFDNLSENIQSMINEGLSGNIDDKIFQKTKTALMSMRQYIDIMSDEYAGMLSLEADALMDIDDQAEADAKYGLMNVILNNIGEYVHRSYRAFDDKTWNKNVPTEVLNNAREYLRGQLEKQGVDPDKIPNRIEVVMNEILKNGTAYSNFETFIKESKLGAKDLSVLKKRRSIAPEIRALLGEYKDPRLNFAKSVTKMSRLIWNQRFLYGVKKVGDGVFLFKGQDRPPWATEEIAAEGSEVYSPLNGYWTSPDIVQAFKDALGKEQMAVWYRKIVQLNGVIKFGKTILSPTTAARNWQSAFFFTLANGHFDLMHMAKSVSGLREYFHSKGESVKLAYLRELKKLGVVYDTPYAGEMMQLLSDAQTDKDLISEKGKMPFRTALRYAQKFYQYGDDFWKIIGFENEKQNLIEAGMSEPSAKKEAAERIRNTYPTYSMVGRLVKSLRRFPLAGTFVSFPAEIIRTQSNMVRYIAQDLKSSNPKMKKLAYKRIAGMALSAGMIYGAQALSRQLIGVDDDEDEAVRILAAPWNKNSNLMYVKRDKDGNLRYIDLSFVDPYDYFKRPVMAILRDQPWEDKLSNVLYESFEPFLGADILAEAVFEVVANKRMDTGTEVYKKSDLPLNQLKDIALRLKKLLPGIYSTIERSWMAMDGKVSSSGKKYNLSDEAWAVIGWRLTTFDPKTPLYYRTFEFRDARTDASRVILKKIRDRNEVTDKDLKSAYETTNKIRKKAFSDMSKIASAAKTSGMNEQQIRIVLKNSGISKKDINYIMNDDYPEWRPTPQQKTADMKKAGALGYDRKTILDRYNKVNRMADAATEKGDNEAKNKPLNDVLSIFGIKQSNDKAHQQLSEDLDTISIGKNEDAQNAYYEARKLVFDWLEDNGERKFATPTRKGNAIHYYRQAMRFGDIEAAIKHLEKYYDMGGKKQPISKGFGLAHPLSSISQDKKFKFRKSLSPKENETIDRAIEWYNKTYR